MTPKIGITIAAVAAALDNRYHIVRELGVGGQAVVFEALREGHPEQLRSERIALKVYSDPNQDERVVREIQALEGYRHPNLANLLEHGIVVIGGEQTRYIVWEYIDGDPLDKRLLRGPLPPRTVACILRDVCRAVAHVWLKRIVHRDVNPKNIMLRVSGEDAVLLDLGVARHLDRTTLTAMGATWGTLGYFSPEQARGEPLTCHSDTFSLGLTCQELLLGTHPTGRDQRLIPGGLRRTGALIPAVPAQLADMIDSMLNPRAAFRPLPSKIADECADLVRRL
jgi:eukaryotic-like serine/threonine-protein kinase